MNVSIRVTQLNRLCRRVYQAHSSGGTRIAYPSMTANPGYNTRVPQSAIYACTLLISPLNEYLFDVSVNYVLKAPPPVYYIHMVYDQKKKKIHDQKQKKKFVAKNVSGAYRIGFCQESAY